MSVARVTEIIASSPKSFDDAMDVGVARAAKTLKNVTGAWVQALVGAALGYGLIAGLAAYWRKTRGYEGIGLGDAKLLAAGGAWVGVMGLPVILLIASILGLLAGVIVSSAPQSRQARLALPFGPCLRIGIWIVWCLTNVGLFNQSVPGS